MYYECKLTRMGTDDQGKVKRFNEVYLVEALSIYEAITRFENTISQYFPEHEVIATKKTAYSEVIIDGSGDKYYRVKMNILTLNERTGAEEKTAKHILIAADDLDAAKAKYEEMLKTWMADVALESISETKIVDYFNHDLQNQA